MAAASAAVSTAQLEVYNLRAELAAARAHARAAEAVRGSGPDGSGGGAANGGADPESLPLADFGGWSGPTSVAAIPPFQPPTLRPGTVGLGAGAGVASKPTAAGASAGSTPAGPPRLEKPLAPERKGVHADMRALMHAQGAPRFLLGI